MRRRRTGRWLFLLAVVCAAIIYFIFHYRYALLPTEAVSLPGGSQVCFLPEGILVPGEAPVVYTAAGKALTGPETGLDGTFWGQVVQHGPWLLGGDGAIYDGERLPLRQVCRAEEGLSILDFLPLGEDSFLLYAAYQGETPFLEWVKPGAEPAALHPASQYVYMGMDGTAQGTMSVLFLDVSGASPCTQVLHCREGEIVGSLSIKNALYYAVYRLPSQILLVGTHEIVCYNVEDGRAAWSVSWPGVFKPLILRDGERILCYAGDNARGIDGNALWVEPDGSFQAYDFPPGLTALVPYRDKLAAVQNHNRLLALQQNGTVIVGRDAGTDILELYWPASAPQQLFGRTGDGQVLIFGAP